MSEIRVRARDEIAFEIFKTPSLSDEENKQRWDRLPEYETKAYYRNLANIALDNLNVAVVDREAMLPFPGIGLDHRLATSGSIIEAYRLAQQDMTEAGWVKEEK